jgi:hypothetical protein
MTLRSTSPTRVLLPNAIGSQSRRGAVMHTGPASGAPPCRKPAAGAATIDRYTHRP